MTKSNLFEGVHAIGQVVSFKVQAFTSLDKMVDRFNEHLPEDIKIFGNIYYNNQQPHKLINLGYL